jgi:hypothetical protein
MLSTDELRWETAVGVVDVAVKDFCAEDVV